MTQEQKKILHDIIAELLNLPNASVKPLNLFMGI